MLFDPKTYIIYLSYTNHISQEYHDVFYINFINVHYIEISKVKIVFSDHDGDGISLHLQTNIPIRTQRCFDVHTTSF